MACFVLWDSFRIFFSHVPSSLSQTKIFESLFWKSGVPTATVEENNLRTAMKSGFFIKRTAIPCYLYKFIIPLLMLAKIQAHCTILQNVLQSGFAATIKCICHPNYAKQVVVCKTTSKTELGFFIHLWKKCQHEIYIYFVVEVLYCHYYRKLDPRVVSECNYHNINTIFIILANTSVAINNVTQNEIWFIQSHI